MRARASISFGLAVATVLTCVTPAQANGRFPRAMRLQELPDDQLAIYGTYGLLVSRNAGANWFHVCESATGPFNGEAAILEGLSGGRLLLGTDADLKRSEDQACGWSPVLTPGASGLLIDVSRSVSSNDLYVVLNNLDPETGLYVTLQRSGDEADTFEPLAELPWELIERAFTVDVAPSDPDRIYVSGVNPDGVGVVLRLSDQGQTAEASELPLTSASAAPYIAAVHPSDPDTLFVRTDELVLVDNTTTAKDRLLVSRDGGETWTHLIERHAKLLGFALSPDGETVLAGYGDPILFSFSVDRDDVGIYRFSLDMLGDVGDAGASFEKIHDQNTTCLRWTSDTLYACSIQQEVGTELGIAPSSAGYAASTLDLTPVLDLSKVLPLQCADDSSVAQCIDDIIYGWPAACAKLGAECDLNDPGSDARRHAPPDTSSDGCHMGQRASSFGSTWAFVGVILGLLGSFVGRRWRKS
ncbi:MAG TPA: hypothetical protein VHO25_24900 [Polyangiaceae bacterium]|nr:hypothetical protein [Polyangiaceae bacterium]